MLINAGARIDTEAYDYGTVLQVAARHGHERVVQILLDAGADPNIDKGRYGSALEAVTYASSESEARIRIIRMLLGAGINYDVRSSALQSAVAYPEALEILLKTDVNIESTDRFGNKPLQWAVFYGWETVVEILLKNGADPNASGGQWGSVLSNASRRGHPVIAQMLLNAGAVLNSEDGDLVLASEEGKPEVMQILLRAGADVDQPGGHYNRPLQAAAAFHHESAVSVLVDAGAKINAQGGFFGSSLQAACSDSVPWVQLLGSPNRNVWRERSRYRSEIFSFEDRLLIIMRNFESRIDLRLCFSAEEKPGVSSCGISLQKMSSSANDSMIELLQHAGANVKDEADSHKGQSRQVLLDNLVAVILRVKNRTDGRPQQDRFGAIEPDSAKEHESIISIMQGGPCFGSNISGHFPEGHEWVAQALLDTGATIQTSGGEPVLWQNGPGEASANIVQTLLKAGANVNLQGGLYGNALQAAARYSHKDIVQLLLDNGADIHKHGGEYGTVMQAACASFSPDLELVQLLLHAGADVNTQGGVYGSALQAACYRGSIEVVRMLLNAGADVDIPGGVYGHPLQAACASPNPQEELVRMLLEAGARADATGGKFGCAIQALEMKFYRPVVQIPSWADGQ